MFPVHAPPEIRGLSPIAYQNLPEDLVDSFRTVLDGAQSEKPLQQFFEQQPAALLTGIVHPHTAWVFPRPSLPKPEGGSWIPDFMICDWTSIGPLWTIIELESPTASPLTSKGLSALCRQAQQQIDDYRRHLREHSVFLRDGGWPIAGERAPAWTIIGRRHEQRTAMGVKRLANLREYAIEVASYDRILSECDDRVRANAASRRGVEELMARVRANKSEP